MVGRALRRFLTLWISAAETWRQGISDLARVSACASQWPVVGGQLLMQYTGQIISTRVMRRRKKSKPTKLMFAQMFDDTVIDADVGGNKQQSLY